MSDIQHSNNAQIQRVPPQNLDAEESVLATLLAFPEDCFDQIQASLEPEHFYRKIHQVIYKASKDLSIKSRKIDYITIAEELKSSRIFNDAGGTAYLDKLMSIIPSSSNYMSYVQIIVEKASKRQLIEAANFILSESYEEKVPVTELLEQAENQIFSIGKTSDDKFSKHAEYYAEEAWDFITEAVANKGGTSGVSSGLADLDKLTMGFQESDMIVIGARPSMGKTAFVLQLCKNIAIDQKLPLVMYSLEMPGRQLMNRIFSCMTKINGSKLITGDSLSQTEVKALMKAQGQVSSSPLYINDTGSMTIYDIKNDLRRVRKSLQDKDEKAKIEMVVIDYLGLIRSSDPKMSEYDSITKISQELKAVGKEFKVPIIVLSQLSRNVESRSDKRPMMSDLRSSGAIEQDADLIMFLYRDEYYNPNADESKGKAEIIVAKHRNGPTGIVHLAFDKNNASFYNMSSHEG
ncbi:MAG: replicative DNA helicase [Candidatus Cloacimonadota bacterium]|nr:MAG: replicative DNA helicase [Candidatus Cloacimonadota bacterium]